MVKDQIKKVSASAGVARGGISRIFDISNNFEEQVLDLLADLPKKSKDLAPPVVILLLGWLFLRWSPPLDPASTKILQISPYISAVAGMLLAVHFHRGRTFMLLLNVTLFYWFYRTYLSVDIHGANQEKVLHALSTLVPVNAFAFTLLKERGIFTDAGKIRFFGFGAGAFAVYFLFHYNYQILAPLYAARLKTLSFASFIHVSHIAFVLFLLAAAGVTVLALKRKKPMEIWVLGYLAATFTACNWAVTPHATIIFALAASFMMIAALLKESYHMAFHDDLTGIPSRRALNEALYGLGSSYSIAMVDVDHFKKFNDTYGHEVGDQVLKLVAKKLAGVGGNGKAFRYGGEEFTILFRELSAAEAAPHMEELRRKIADYNMVLRGDDRPKDDRKGKKRSTGSRTGPTFNVTVSIGVAEHGRDLPTPEEVIIAADKALYKAKQHGRNQLCMAS